MQCKQCDSTEYDLFVTPDDKYCCYHCLCANATNTCVLCEDCTNVFYLKDVFVLDGKIRCGRCDHRFLTNVLSDHSSMDIEAYSSDCYWSQDSIENSEDESLSSSELWESDSSDSYESDESLVEELYIADTCRGCGKVYNVHVDANLELYQCVLCEDQFCLSCMAMRYITEPRPKKFMCFSCEERPKVELYRTLAICGQDPQYITAAIFEHLLNRENEIFKDNPLPKSIVNKLWEAISR